MVDDLYDPQEAHINQIASGVSLFVSALAATLAAVEDVAPEDRTGPVWIGLLDTACRMMIDREDVTTEAASHALSILQMVKEGVDHATP